MNSLIDLVKSSTFIGQTSKIGGCPCKGLIA